MTWRMTWRHHANWKRVTFSNSASQSTIEQKKNHLPSTNTNWDKYRIFSDVITSWMMSFHYDISSCEYNSNNIIDFNSQINFRSKTGIYFQVRSPAKMTEVGFLTSCDHASDVMTSRNDKTTSCKYKNDNSLVFKNINIYINKCVILLQQRQADIREMSLWHHDVASWRHDIMQTQKR